MNALARALVLGVKHIEHREDDLSADADVQMLEELAAIIAAASTEEQQNLASAAEELGERDLVAQIFGTD